MEQGGLFVPPTTGWPRRLRFAYTNSFMNGSARPAVAVDDESTTIKAVKFIEAVLTIWEQQQTSPSTITSMARIVYAKSVREKCLALRRDTLDSLKVAVPIGVGELSNQTFNAGDSLTKQRCQIIPESSLQLIWERILKALDSNDDDPHGDEVGEGGGEEHIPPPPPPPSSSWRRTT